MPSLRTLAVLALLGTAAVAPAALAQPFRDAFTAVTPRNFDGGGAVGRQFHLQAGAYRYQATVEHTAAVRPLPSAPDAALAATMIQHAGRAQRFADYVAGDPLIDGVVVLRGGRIVFEAYPNMPPWQRHFAWSVTKVVTATVLASLVRDGVIDMSAPVERYVAALDGTAWAGTSMQHIADMASGIACLDSDGYQDTSTCVYTMEESLDITAATGRNPDFIAHLQGMRRGRSAGAANEYVSANTNVLALAMEAATGRDFSSLLRERVWSRIGAEADALMAISPAGYAYASGGLSARLRDIARFGELFVRPADFDVLTAAQVAAMQGGGLPLAPSERRRARIGDDLPTRAAWQWDYIWNDGAMFKGGYSGQGLYVDPARDLVIAWFGTGEDFDARINAMLPVARQLARQLPD